MSDCYLRLIPTDPAYAPPLAAQQRARALLWQWLPRADDVTTSVSSEICFVDQGGDFEGVYCPTCGADLEARWSDAMSRAFTTRFSDLRVVTPCCGIRTSLNELRYVCPAGFARFVLQAMNPSVPDFSGEALASLERILGTGLRVIWTRV